MAAAIKALNAKIRSNPYTDYLCSTRELLLPQLRLESGIAPRSNTRKGVMSCARPSPTMPPSTQSAY